MVAAARDRRSNTGVRRVRLRATKGTMVQTRCRSSQAHTNKVHISRARPMGRARSQSTLRLRIRDRTRIRLRHMSRGIKRPLCLAEVSERVRRRDDGSLANEPWIGRPRT